MPLDRSEFSSNPYFFKAGFYIVESNFYDWQA